MSLADNYRRLIKDIPDGVKLIAVSKTKSPPEIMELYNCGQKAFGENKVQELLSKAEVMPDDIQWHMIGHLQSNKVRYIVPIVQMIHAVDSLKLLKTIEKEAKKTGHVVSCLLQIHIAEEDTKFGMSSEEVFQLLDNPAYQSMKHVKIKGLMGMATFTDDTDKVRSEFRFLKTLFEQVKKGYFAGDDDFCELSMGMTDDFAIAIEEGSTMVRIGSALFGERE